MIVQFNYVLYYYNPIQQQSLCVAPQLTVGEEADLLSKVEIFSMIETFKLFDVFTNVVILLTPTDSSKGLGHRVDFLGK